MYVCESCTSIHVSFIGLLSGSLSFVLPDSTRFDWFGLLDGFVRSFFRFDFFSFCFLFLNSIATYTPCVLI